MKVYENLMQSSNTFQDFTQKQIAMRACMYVLEDKLIIIGAYSPLKILLSDRIIKA